MTEKIRLFIQLSRLPFVIGVAIVYTLGAGIAHYLGSNIDWGVYLIGQMWITLLQLSTQYFNEYFNYLADQVNPNRTFLTGGSGALGPGKLSRSTALISGLTCLAFLASLTVILVNRVNPPLEVYLIMGIAFLGAFFYSVPPVRLESSGYGELTTSVIVGILVPALAFLLQGKELNRLLAMTSFPLVAMHLAMFLALEMPDYATDQKFKKNTFTVRVGWQTAMTIHNVMILTAFLLLVLARSFGYPWFAMVAGLLPLPLGIFQIFQMRSIGNGAKPNWKALTIGSVALFVLMAYLLALAFWTN